MSIIFDKSINNIHLSFDSSHFQEIRTKHARQHEITIDSQWHSSYHMGHQIIKHPLLYRVIKDKGTGILYIISRVLKTFYCGWYYTALVQRVDQDSCLVHLSNINSIATIDFDFNDRFDITDITVDEFFGDKIITFGDFSEPAIYWFHHIVDVNDKVIKWFESFNTTQHSVSINNQGCDSIDIVSNKYTK